MLTTITLTADEAVDRGVWDSLCKMRGLNEWALNEGLMSGDYEFTLTKEEATKIGLITKGANE